jgi:hypothetical protein
MPTPAVSTKLPDSMKALLVRQDGYSKSQEGPSIETRQSHDIFVDNSEFF